MDPQDRERLARGAGDEAGAEAGAGQPTDESPAGEAARPDDAPIAGADRPSWVWAGTAVAVIGCVAALPTVDNGSSSPPWTVEATHAVDDDVVAAADEAGSVLVQFSAHMSTGAVGPPLLVALQDAGIPFYVSDDALVRQLGEARRYDPGDADARLSVIASRDAEAEPGQTLVAEWSELSRAERDELFRLTEQVEDLVDEHGLPLADGAAEYLRFVGDDEMLERIAEQEDDPVEAVADGLVYDLWFGPHAKLRGDGPLLDTGVFPSELLDRWYELRTLYDQHVVKVYIEPL